MLRTRSGRPGSCPGGRPVRAPSLIDNLLVAQPASRKPDIQTIEARLWGTAAELRANSHLKSSEYSVPVLGLIFLKYADSRFTALEQELAGKGSGRRQLGK